MRFAVVLSVAIAALVSQIGSAPSYVHIPSLNRTQDSTWFWFATCDGPSLTIEVQLDGRPVFSETVPL
jgi:hypothetical protein